jgi:hypothetical protein
MGEMRDQGWMIGLVKHSRQVQLLIFQFMGIIKLTLTLSMKAVSANVGPDPKKPLKGSNAQKERRKIKTVRCN